MTKIKVKQLTWELFGRDYYAKEFDVCVSTNGSGRWGLSPRDYPHFGDFPFKSVDEAKQAAQKDFEAYIMDRIEIEDE